MVVSATELLDALYGGDDLLRTTRVNHARGVTVEGTFTASRDARRLCGSRLFNGRPAPTTVRFSNSSGIPDIADSDPRASPRGLAISIQPYGENASTFVGHSVEGFPASTPAQFLAFLAALRDPADLADFLRKNPAARSFLSRLPSRQSSFAREDYHFLHAYSLRAGDVTTVGRIIIGPPPLIRGHSVAESVTPAGTLAEELTSRVENSGVELRMHLQPRSEGDDVRDIALPWGGHHERIQLGTIRLKRLAPDQVAAERTVYDPSLLSSGITLVGDPMIDVRSGAYRLSHRRRSR
jgi:catalase